ncbi:hypothetical protein [Caldimonas brevitalea]|uniref:HNH endonuclease n=1 Tax=Caldimonas brevitalea TaxID=413882 RepID=A0A0G3BHA9_9BURK|nr:hypothetical protein [Caldimonas brevitalea]AKJ28789.1 hypothetical protein AAW51_2098 [Caldimonas brevitalea]
MRTKNAKAISAAEGRYLAMVKRMPCAVCSKPATEAEPSEAHHIEQGLHFTAIPLCDDCHRGSFNGIHGQRRIWSVLKKTELSCLNETIRALQS